ncbi:FAD dependent oxidoreductase [Verticillium alfalfae VaMs.102]|uniref:FAD dependent oxidoreductase n=1 Tax=Verticillium alfalfae (strain VaMs.102 / ATCC MYA-4576 / FGSC 10136) TaxID=526221 RepID=C9SQV0_VERA1|nr:FAD dependent oxidoreductase [Verticillium alfalfae VaMs.102]EEY21225.1 FAD dependent oxidoreductase [Verticillium alfalfae VaMs.102]
MNSPPPLRPPHAPVRNDRAHRRSITRRHDVGSGRAPRHHCRRVRARGPGGGARGAPTRGARAHARARGKTGGNSIKASSGINGAGTRFQKARGIETDTSFYGDTVRSAGTRFAAAAAEDAAGIDRAGLVGTLTGRSAEAVAWLADDVGVDLSVVAPLGGHSVARTHRGAGALPPGAAIVTTLLKRLQADPRFELTTSAEVVGPDDDAGRRRHGGSSTRHKNSGTNWPARPSFAGGGVCVGKVTPIVHFTMGGAAFDAEARVLRRGAGGVLEPIEGLWAAGEITGGVHGDNRLGGSSLLECAVFGRMAGQQAAKALSG